MMILMPAKDTICIREAGAYFHVYNRGAFRQTIFRDDDDYRAYLQLLKRYLSGQNARDEYRNVYVDIAGNVELVAYCLMPNHFHLLLFQDHPEGITQLMRRISTGYVRYFMRKYNHSGTLLQGRFKSRYINNDSYLLHISRYIHLNPVDLGTNFRSYPYSSYGYYKRNKFPVWLKPKKVIAEHSNVERYLQFNENYLQEHLDLKELKRQIGI